MKENSKGQMSPKSSKKDSRKFRGNRSNSKPRFEEEERETKGAAPRRERTTDRGDTTYSNPSAKYAREAQNDASWYLADPRSANEAGKLNFFDALGKVVDLTSGHQVAGTDAIKSTSIPGILALECAPTIGKSTSEQSAANIAANRIYSFLRYANSGALTYDAPDVMMYLLAMDQIFACYGWLYRAYATMNTFSGLNRYTPKGLMLANHLDYEDFKANMANFKFALLQWEKKINSMFTPMVFTLLVRHFWMYTNYYADSESAKAQIYAYVPKSFWQYSAKSSTTGTSLTPVTLASNKYYTFGEIKSIMDNMLEAVWTDQDCLTMSGHLMRAYGTDARAVVPPIADDAVIMPVYSPEVLSQIENATCLVDISENSVTQVQSGDNSPYINFNPTFRVNSPAYSYKKILNMHLDEITTADVMVASRMMVTFDGLTTVTKGSAYTGKASSMGSEVVVSMALFEYDGTTKTFVRKYVSEQFLHSAAGKMDTDAIARRLSVTQFKQHPIMAVLDADSDKFKPLSILADLDNYTLVDTLEMDKLHDVALMSEFGVPFVINASSFQNNSNKVK